VIYECGDGSWVFMYPSAGAGTSKASTAFWAVDDVAAEVRELKARGVVFEEYDIPGIKMENSIANAGGAKTAWFKDSEGSILAISQRVLALGFGGGLRFGSCEESVRDGSNGQHHRGSYARTPLFKRRRGGRCGVCDELAVVHRLRQSADGSA
jgi:hypothetical protein